jgi:hypothetical protein
LPQAKEDAEIIYEVELLQARPGTPFEDMTLEERLKRA